MEIVREQNVASYFTIPLIDAATRPSYKASPTLAAGDVKIIRHTGGTWNVANPGTLPSAIAGATTQVLVTMTAAELNPDDNQYPIIVQFIDQTATKEWDDQTIIIHTRATVANLKQINDLSVVGNLATLTLKQLHIENSTGDAIHAKSTGSNGRGINAEGNGSGPGLKAIGGTSGPGIRADGGTAGNTNGIEAYGVTGGNGMQLNAGLTGNGLKVYGGGTSGAAIRVIGQAGNAEAMLLEGQGTGHGLKALSGSGATGSGIHCESLATAGSGLRALGKGSAPGVDIDGGTTGNGMDITGVANGVKIIGGQSSSQGHGIHVIGGSTVGGGVGDYHAVYLEGTGLASHGLKGAGAGSGAGLYGLGGVNDGHGIHGASQVNGDGIRGSGGTEGEGIAGWGGTAEGFGILANAVADGDGLRCVGRATGHGIRATSGAGATGDGIRAEAVSTNGNGIMTIKTGTGIDLHASDHGDGSWQEDGFQKNTASTNFEFEMVQLADHITPALGAAITAQRSIDGGVYGACTNAAVEVGLGTYKINFSAADLNGNIITFKFSAAACDTRTITIKTYTP